MYNLLSLVIGAVVAIMIAINGQLTSAYDLFVSAAIIHVIGTVFSLIVCLCRHQKILVKAEHRGCIWVVQLVYLQPLAIICLMDGSV